MPHKHTRKGQDASSFDLPPSSLAQSLSVGKKPQVAEQRSRKRKRPEPKSTSYGFDDTPSAFKRLLAFQQTGKHPKGLDDGAPPVKKSKPSKSQQEPSKFETPKIMPGEKLADFAARVDQAIPVSNLSRRGKGLEDFGIKNRQTRLEKKMHRKYAEWRKEDDRRKDKEQEALDLKEEEEAEDYGTTDQVSEPTGKKGRRSKQDDPWADLARLRGQKASLNDVAQEPPRFDKIPTQKLKIKGGVGVDVANVPRLAGSLKKREDLSSARRSIIEGYRKMMDSKRA